MAFDSAQFRLNFPEFSDVVRYPDPMLDFWAEVGVLSLIAERWKTLYDYGVQLFVAHNITLAAVNAAAGAAGGVPGQMTGVTSNKAVGSVSVGYDTQTTAEQNAGTWNTTSYGKQLIRLARMIGAGATVV